MSHVPRMNESRPAELHAIWHAMENDGSTNTSLHSRARSSNDFRRAPYVFFSDFDLSLHFFFFEFLHDFFFQAYTTILTCDMTHSRIQ